MSAARRLGLVVLAIGVLTTVAPFVLPRRVFGELGHGDGMGLIGLVLIGLLVAGLGLIVTLTGAVADTARKADAGQPGK